MTRNLFSALFRNFSGGYCHTIAIAIAIGLCNSCSAPTDRDSLELANIGSIQSLGKIVGKQPRVVVTNTVLCDLTQQIAKDTIDLVCLLSPGIDPHAYQTTPEARQEIDRAQLILYGGYHLEPGLEKAIGTTSNPISKVAVHEVAVPQPQVQVKDGKKTIDPHVWHDAKNGIEITNVITNKLAKLLPEKAETYRRNAKKINTEIERIDIWMRSQIDTIPQQSKTLFTAHDALGYYSRAYGIAVSSLRDLNAVQPADTNKVKELTAKIEQAKVPSIFVELSLNPPIVKTIAQDARVGISAAEIYADGLGEAYSSGGSYQQMLISNTKEIVKGLGGKYQPFQ